MVAHIRRILRLFAFVRLVADASITTVITATTYTKSAAVFITAREYILQRQSEGIAIAKTKGVYKGRKPIEHPDFNKIVSIWKNGNITAVEAMKRLGGMKPSTFYRKVKNFKK